MEYIDSGSTLLNLALTGLPNGGWPVGRISNVIGDSSTGKTMLATEAAMSLLDNSPKGVKPRVVYYETEAAFDMDYAAKLGLDTKRVEFLQGRTIENFKDDVEKVLDEMIKDGKGRGLIILDSLDSISSDDELKAGIAGEEHILTKLAGILSKDFGIEEERVELLMMCEEEFNMEIPDDTAEKFTTLEDVIRHISWKPPHFNSQLFHTSILIKHNGHSNGEPSS